MPHVFLSYSRSDLGLARRLRGDLVAGGVDIWSDRELGLGGSWITQVSRALSRSYAIVLLASPAALVSKWVMREVHAAQTLGLRLVPLLTGGARFSDLPPSLAGINGVDLGEGYEESVRVVVSALRHVEFPRTASTGVAHEARILVVLTGDDSVAALVRQIARPIGLVVVRPGGETSEVITVLVGAHILVIDEGTVHDGAFAAGYVVGRGGWVICLTDGLRQRLPVAKGVAFSRPTSTDLEREVGAAAFLPLRPT